MWKMCCIWGASCCFFRSLLMVSLFFQPHLSFTLPRDESQCLNPGPFNTFYFFGTDFFLTDVHLGCIQAQVSPGSQVRNGPSFDLHLPYFIHFSSSQACKYLIGPLRSMKNPAVALLLLLVFLFLLLIVIEEIWKAGSLTSQKTVGRKWPSSSHVYKMSTILDVFNINHPRSLYTQYCSKASIYRRKMEAHDSEITY